MGLESYFFSFTIFFPSYQVWNLYFLWHTPSISSFKIKKWPTATSLSYVTGKYLMYSQQKDNCKGHLGAVPHTRDVFSCWSMPTRTQSFSEPPRKSIQCCTLHDTKIWSSQKKKKIDQWHFIFSPLNTVPEKLPGVFSALGFCPGTGRLLSLLRASSTTSWALTQASSVCSPLCFL